MEIIIRIALVFFVIQFMVVMTIMIAALLLARVEVPILGGGAGHPALTHSFAYVIHLPSRILHSVVRLVQSAHSFRSAH